MDLLCSNATRVLQSNYRKTIKPTNIGGYAGGEKYEVAGIIFKFAVDDKGLYGSDEGAMRAAAQELLGASSMIQFHSHGCHVPLLCAIDHLGFRLLAVAKLPISADTLVRGSSDAGASLSNSDTHCRDAMKTIAQMLNLKSHAIRDKRGVTHEIVGPFDLEAHRSVSDKRLYFLDFARLFPPEPPQRGAFCFTRMLRPEFVRSYHRPLSSDAFCALEVDRLDNSAEVCCVFLLFSGRFLADLQSPASPDGRLSSQHHHSILVNAFFCIDLATGGGCV